jgi:hypothetical protein
MASLSPQDGGGTAYHHVRASALSWAGSFIVPGPGSRLMPIANAVLTAMPVYMYDTAKISVTPFFL